MKKSKLAFIQPMINDGNLTPPLGTLIMASLIEEKGWEVRFFDERIDNNALNSLLEFRPDIVGISAVTASVLRGRELAVQVKDAFPETITVFGGPHPSAMPEEVSGWEAVDFAVVGEGEKTITDLCEWYLSGKIPSTLNKIPNLTYKCNGEFVRNESISPLSSEDLDRLPAPAFHLLDIERIFSKFRHGLFQKGKRVLPIMGSRGCPHQCTFCCRVMGGKIRYRSTDVVLREIESMISRYNLDEIWFEDDNFTANPQRAHLILDSLIERNLGVYVKFANGIRADGVNSEILEKMKRAGCYSISFGIESGSPRILKLMKKNLSLEKARANVNIAKSLGFLVGSNCIIGYPGETVEDIDESLDYFTGLDLDSMAVVNLIPFPGTEARELCREKGYLTPEATSWDNYVFDIQNPKILIETEFLSRETLRKKINEAYRKIYFNPRRIYRIAKHMRLEDIAAGSKIMLSKIFESLKQQTRYTS